MASPAPPLPEGVGLTALIVNRWRMSANANAGVPLYIDTLGHIFDSPVIDEAESFASKNLPAAPYAMVVRTHFIDVQLERLLSQGYEQIVVLGSGLDCRAVKYHRPGRKFLEIDSQQILEFKRAKLAACGIRLPSVCCPGNYLTAGPIGAVMDKHGLKADEKTVFIWEGNTMYLQRSEALDFLASLFASCPRSALIFDYLAPEMIGHDSTESTDPKQDSLPNSIGFTSIGAKWTLGLTKDDVIEAVSRQGPAYSVDYEECRSVKELTIDAAAKGWRGPVEDGLSFEMQAYYFLSVLKRSG